MLGQVYLKVVFSLGFLHIFVLMALLGPLMALLGPLMAFLGRLVAHLGLS